MTEGPLFYVHAHMAYRVLNSGQILSVIDPTGVVTRLSYDARGNLTGVLNAVGDMLKVEHDAQDRPVSVVSPSGGTMRVEYDVASRPVRVIDPVGNVTVYTYTPAGKVASITDAVGGVLRFEYNAAGELVAQVAPDGARTVREINELGYTVAETDPLGHVTKFVHDGMGRVTEKIDPAGNVWASRYNAADTMVEHTDPTGVLTRVSRDSAAGKITHQDGVGNTATVGFDALGRVMSSIDPSGAVTSWAYQFLTNTTAASSGEGDREPAHRQGASEPVRVQDPTENLVRVPGAHALRTCTDAAGQVSGEVRDASGRVLRQVSASGAVTEYSYDACGRVASVTDADGVMTEYRYDADSRLVAKTRAGVVVESFVYDLCGRVLERRAGTKLVGRYAYDAAGRVVRCVDAAWGTRSFSYDACGRVVKAVSGVGGTCFFDYDGAGRLLACRVATSEGFATISYAYDAVGNVVQRTTPYGSTVYGYSPGGRIRSTQQIPAGIGVEDSSSVGDKPGVAEFAYDALGYLERVQVGECVSSWVRDTSGAVMGYTEEVLGEADEPSGSSSGMVQGVRVRRNPAGKITRVEDTVKGSWCEYAYDASGRLIRAVSSDDVSVVWVYDPVGLLMREETHQEGALVRVRAFSYAGERVQTVRLYEALEDGGSSAAPVAGVVEDLTGLDTSSLVCTGSVQYSYDVRGFRTGAADHTGAAVTWGWDALGSLERVERINHSSDSLLGSHLSAASDGNSTVWFAASSVRNMPVAVGSQQGRQDPVVSPLVWDTTVPDAASLVGVGVTEAVSAGSVLGGRDSILTGTGAGVYSFGTDIFGVASPVTWGSNTTAAAGNGLPGLPADVGLTDQGALATVGGELMGARLYDPVTAGFLSPDPVEPVAGSGYMGASYLFASGDPVNLHDPTGLEPIPVEVMTEYIRYVKSGDIQRDALNKFWEDVKHKWNRFWSSSIDDWNKFWEDFLKDPVGWINSHPEELRNGAVMVLSVMMLGTPLSPFAVGYLAGVGTSWIIQRWENGKIDPRQLQIDGLIGAGSEALFMLIGRVYRVVRSGKGVEFNTSGGRLSIPGQAPSSMAKFDTRLVGAAESKILQAGESGFYTRLKPGDAGYGILKSPARELQETRYPKIEVKPVTGGARSATEVPQVGEVPPAQASAAKGTEIPRTVPDEVRPPAGSARESNITLDAVEDPKVYRDGEASSTNKGAGTPETQGKLENPQSEITPETGGTTKGRENTPHEISSGDHHTPKPEEPTEPEKPSPRGKREEVTTATEADAKNHVYHESGINNVREVTDLAQVRQELHDLPDGYGKTTGYFRYEADPMKGDAPQGGGLDMDAPRPKDVFDKETGEWAGRKVGRTKSQNDDLEAYVEYLKDNGAEDFLIDQQQVDVAGRKVGTNRPDLQFTKDGKRYYVEWDRTTSGREIGHAERIAANDPAHGGIELRIVDPYKK